MVDMTNNHNLFPLPTWAPALRRVPMPLETLNRAYTGGDGARRRAPSRDPAVPPPPRADLADCNCTQRM